MIIKFLPVSDNLPKPLFLLDSNICIYVLEGRGEKLRKRIEGRSPGELVTSSIVYAEVMRGIDPQYRTKFTRAETFFETFPVQPFDRDAASRYREVPFRRGRFDRLIAAHALALGLTIVTSNVADFADVPDLKVEDWTG